MTAPSFGSQQLRLFRIAMRDGANVEDAAAIAGMSDAEARLHAADDAKNPPPPECFELIRPQPKEADVARSKKDQPDSTIVEQPNLKALKSLFLNDIKPATEKSAGARGDLSAAWKTAENDLYCNKGAAKLLYKLFGMSEETRDDFLRTFLPGLKEMNLVPSADLAGDGMDDLVDEMSAGIVAGAKTGMGTEGLTALQ